MTQAAAPWQPRWSGRRLARLASWVAIGLSLSLVVLVAAGTALLREYDGNITRIPGVIDAQAPPARGPQPLNVLLVGSDSREGLTGAEAFQGTGREFITGERSDVVILAHLSADRQRAELVSIPRDTYVDIPAFRDPDTGEQRPARRSRINTAFDLGGPPLLVDTVQQLTGLQLQHYVQVDFRGFRGLVDRLGGVEICLNEAQEEFQSGIDLPAGRQTVGGEQALAFVRQRAGLAGGDVGRIERQQLLLGALVREVLSAGTLLNPRRLNGVLQVVTGSLQVDETLTADRLQQLALSLRGLQPGAVVFTTAPIADIAARRAGASVVLLDLAASDRLFDRLGRDLPRPAPPLPPAGAPPPPDARTAAENVCT